LVCAETKDPVNDAIMNKRKKRSKEKNYGAKIVAGLTESGK
jgi:hypothetical protein